MNIYIDESGDLGSTKKSGKYFIIILITAVDTRVFDFFMRRLKSRKIVSKKNKIKTHELKACNVSVKLLDYFFEKVQKINFKILCLVLDKNKIPLKFKNEQGTVYLHMISESLEYLKKEQKNSKEIFLYFDSRHMQGLSHSSFNFALRSKFLLKRDKTTRFEIRHINSHSSGAIQFADFIAYAFHLKFNKSDDKYYKIIEDKINKTIKIKLPK